MHLIELTDQVYEQFQRRAFDAGFMSVEEFLENLVTNSPMNESTEFDRLFTAEVIAELDRVSGAIKAGAKTFSQAEVDEHFRKKSQAWRDTHAS